MVIATIATAALAQLSLSSVTDVDTRPEKNAAAAADVEMLSQIYPGHETDPLFQLQATQPFLIHIRGCTTRVMRLVVPDIPELKHTILCELHDANYAGHVGYHRTILSVQRMYQWPGMHTAIREYVRGCKVCQQDKHLHRQRHTSACP